jgi:outer membrane protein TolC
VAQAQVLQAGLLPNPQISGNITPVLAGPGITPAWTAGLTEDIRALVTLSARRAGARAKAAQVNADLLWQEWQVIGKARLLAVQLAEGHRLEVLLARSRDLLAGRYARARQALAAGNATLMTLAPDLAALQAVQVRIAGLARLQQTRQHDLDALLGLEPDVAIPLQPPVMPPFIDAAEVRRALPGLPQRRPDLIALQLGYRAQEAAVRAAILGQFPALLIGLTGGSDVSDVRTIGPQVTLDLPIFNRNQGAIALQRATRAQLRAEFTARLAAADGQVAAALADVALVRAQIARVRGQVDRTARVAREAEAAFSAGNIDERSYVDIVITRLDAEEQLIALQQAELELEVALATEIGAGMPSVALAAPAGGVA